MPLLIDTPRWPGHGRLWSHLISDTSFVELHAFADLIGLPPRSFEGDHYDVPAEHYDTVVAAGAQPVSMRGLVLALHASGLRRPKRKGERVLASTVASDADPTPGARVDLLASTLPSPVAPARADVLLFRWSGGVARPSLLLVHDHASAARWSLPGTTIAAGDDVECRAADAVSQQVGTGVNSSDLRICGHTRTLGAGSSWSTYLTSTGGTLRVGGPLARWLPLGEASDVLGSAGWWPLVDWLLDRRQPRST